MELVYSQEREHRELVLAGLRERPEAGREAARRVEARDDAERGGHALHGADARLDGIEGAKRMLDSEKIHAIAWAFPPEDPPTVFEEPWVGVHLARVAIQTIVAILLTQAFEVRRFHGECISDLCALALAQVEQSF